MRWFCPRRMSSFEVTMRLNGRHPYLKETHLDYESRDITVTVTAKDFNHAEKVALYLPHLPRAWSLHVKGIKRVKACDNAARGSKDGRDG